MDVSPRGFITNWMPQSPWLLKTIVQLPLGWSPNAQHQDWLTEIVVQSMRPILQTPASLLKSQNFFLFDPGVWGNVWVARYKVPPPTKSSNPQDFSTDTSPASNAITIQEAVSFAIDALARHDDERSCPIPPMDQGGVEVEWTSHRQNAWPWSRTPSGLSDTDVYNRILSEVPQGSDSPVILFAHGGAFCLMDPANHRSSAARFSKLTNARVLSVRYRLSPQNIFPAALMDMFLTYLSLICPPPGAYHDAVPASRIILAGDSSGGNLVTALQVLLSTLVLHGRTQIRNPWTSGGDDGISIPDPPTAGLSLSSPWLDVTRSLPSCTLNQRYDFIAAPEPLKASLMSTSPMFPPDEIWPAKPVRTETYCEAVMCAHALVSPITTPNQVLAYFPAVYACTGWEGMTDETEVFMRRLAEARSGHEEAKSETGGASEDSTHQEYTDGHGEIFFDGYTGMPHTFSFMAYNQAGVKANENRCRHIKEAVANVQAQADAVNLSTSSRRYIAPRAIWTNGKTMKESHIQLEELGMTSEFSGYVRKDLLTDDFMFTKVEEGRIFRVELEKRLREQERAGEKSQQ